MVWIKMVAGPAPLPWSGLGDLGRLSCRMAVSPFADFVSKWTPPNSGGTVGPCQVKPRAMSGVELPNVGVGGDSVSTAREKHRSYLSCQSFSVSPCYSPRGARVVARETIAAVLDVRRVTQQLTGEPDGLGARSSAPTRWVGRGCRWCV